MSKLVAINPGLAGLSYELGAHWVTIGRDDDNAFQIVETSVSGRHCEVRLRGDALEVRDLRSTNGTSIEGKPIAEAVLQPGQTLRLGEVELRLETTAPPPADASPATASAPVKKPEAAAGIAKQYRVLFVDDSMAFLETISELFGTWGDKTWEIHTAVSADKALAILEKKLMDLIVLDIGMPLLDGVQLLGIIHQRYPNVKKVVLTGESDESRRAACLAAGAELFLVKPVHAAGLTPVFNVLNDLVAWTNRDGFSGALGEIGLPSIVQMECLEGNSLILEVRNPQIDGKIYIEAGAIIHASAGRLAGEKAFHQLLSLTNGEFCLKPFRAPPERSLQGEWESLLAAAARVRDKGNFSDGSDDTILIVKKKPAAQPAPAAESSSGPGPGAGAPPPTPTPAESSPPKSSRSTSGMNFIMLEEMVDADTTLVSNSDDKTNPSDDLKQ